MYIVAIPFNERFEIVKEVKKENKFIRILKDRTNSTEYNYAIQTELEIYNGYSKKGSENLFKKLTSYYN